MTAPQTERQNAGAGIQLECDLRMVAGFLDEWTEAEQSRHFLLSILPDTFHPRGQTFEWPRDKANALRWVEECGVRCGLYWNVNVCRPNLVKKARKEDVQLLRALRAAVARMAAVARP